MKQTHKGVNTLWKQETFYQHLITGHTWVQVFSKRGAAVANTTELHPENKNNLDMFKWLNAMKPYLSKLKT